MKKFSLTYDGDDYEPENNKLYMIPLLPDKVLFCNFYIVFFDINCDGVRIWSGINIENHELYDLDYRGAIKITGVDEL